MASRVTNKRSGKTVEPTSLELNLHAPGMSPLHRAGLGGLAATLRAMERRHRRGRLSDGQMPQGPDLGDNYPWRIEPTKITLAWDEPTDAKGYLRRLFAFAFGLRDGLIDLPGTYRTGLSLAIRVQLQKSLQQTFLTHGPTAGSTNGTATLEVAIGDVPINVRHTVFTSYCCQGWYWLERDEKIEVRDEKTGKLKKLETGRRTRHPSQLPLCTSKGTLIGGLHPLDKKIMPGGSVRHVGLGKRAHPVNA